MFFRKSNDNTPNNQGEILKERLEQLITELEGLKDEAKKKIQFMENTAKGRLNELETKQSILEEQVCMLNHVISSMSPDKRVN